MTERIDPAPASGDQVQCHRLNGGNEFHTMACLRQEATCALTSGDQESVEWEPDDRECARCGGRINPLVCCCPEGATPPADQGARGEEDDLNDRYTLAEHLRKIADRIDTYTDLHLSVDDSDALRNAANTLTPETVPQPLAGARFEKLYEEVLQGAAKVARDLPNFSKTSSGHVHGAEWAARWIVGDEVYEALSAGATANRVKRDKFRNDQQAAIARTLAAGKERA